jgi:hypothetical protein
MDFGRAGKKEAAEGRSGVRSQDGVRDER